MTTPEFNNPTTPNTPDIRRTVDTDRHPFVGDGTLCTGRLGTPDGPLCGNGPTAPIHDPQPAATALNPAALNPPAPNPASLTEQAAHTGHYHGDGCPDHHADTALLANRDAWSILREIAIERLHAEKKFPGQHLPDGTENTEQARRTRDMFRKVTDQQAERGTLTWHAVLREEMYEAFAETDPVKLRAELIQVAAMAVRWIEDIDRRHTPLPALPAPGSPTPPADHQFVPHADPGNPGGYRCGYARSTTDASSFCWRPIGDHPLGVYRPPLPEPGTPGYDPDLHDAALAQRIRDAQHPAEGCASELG